jgi:hypothetical protein
MESSGTTATRSRRRNRARCVGDRDVDLAHGEHPQQRRFRDKITIALESHVAHLLATITTIAHQERPEHLDRHAMLRDQVFVLDHMYMSVFSTAGWILRLGVTISLLMAIHPALALLALFALPAVVTATWRPGVERVAQDMRRRSIGLPVIYL